MRDGEIQLMYVITRILRHEQVWTSLNVLLSGQVLCRASRSKLGSGGRRLFFEELGQSSFCEAEDKWINASWKGSGLRKSKQQKVSQEASSSSCFLVAFLHLAGSAPADTRMELMVT